MRIRTFLSLVSGLASGLALMGAGAPAARAQGVAPPPIRAGSSGPAATSPALLPSVPAAVPGLAGAAQPAAPGLPANPAGLPVATPPALPPSSATGADVSGPVSPPAAQVALAQVLQAARANYDVSIAQRELAGTRADLLAADRSPFPVFTAKASSIDLQNGIGPGNEFGRKRIEKEVGIDWTYERGNKRALRAAAAQRAITAAVAGVQDAQVQQLLAASDAYFDLLAAQERIGQVQEIERAAAQLAQTSARRVQAGDLAAQEGERLAIEARRARSATQEAQLGRQRAALALLQLTGWTANPAALSVQDAWPRLDPDAAADRVYAADWSALLENRPEVRAAQARLLAARAQVDLAESQKKADVTVGASLTHYPGTSNRLVEIRAQVPLQFGYNFEGEIGRALAQYGQAQDQLDKIRLVAGAELQRLQAEAISAADRARAYETDILPRARQVAANSERAFNRGALSIADLLDARRTLNATLLDALEARTDYAKAAGAWQLRTQPLDAAAAP
ncbi:MAG: TolC family protein [Xylophilus ampelinus]